MTNSETSYTIETEQQLWDGTPAAAPVLDPLLSSPRAARAVPVVEN